MLDVFITFDIEIWCQGWKRIDERFADCFQSYVYGPTSSGEYGLPYLLDVLNKYGLTGVFFVEPLFARRFGMEPLAEIVDLIKTAQQEIQLHLHTEWVDEAIDPILPNSAVKRQYLRNFSLSEQTQLIATGKDLISRAGCPTLTAFRAGSFGFNRNTMLALKANDILIDSSYNASVSGIESGLFPGETIVDTTEFSGVSEYPLTVFRDGTKSLRHVQLTACSYREIEGLLWQALEKRRNSFIILLHNFELLNRNRTNPDKIAIKRFHKLCNFLRCNSDKFHVRGFNELAPKISNKQPPPLVSPLWKTAERVFEQIYRKQF